MRAFSRQAQLYIWALAAIAGGCLVLALVQFPLTLQALIVIAFFSALSFAANYSRVILPRRLVEITPATAIDIAAAILFPLSLVILITTIGTVLSELRHRRAWYKAMFNVSHGVFLYTVLHLVFRLSSDGRGTIVDGWHDALAIVAVAVCYFFLDTGLVVLVVALTERLPFLYVWHTNLRNVTWHQISMVCAAFLLALLWSVQPWAIILIVLPVAILRQSVAESALLETQTQEAVEALADTIDARDDSTHQHSERVTWYARAIAEAMGLAQVEIERVTMSARLHDLGKVGIGDAWLHKPGPLTDEERAQFQRHSELGADIVARFPLLGVERGMVRSHHERWDGRGYPDGLSGEKIPLGARIIAVADSFDAMTSDRPYRKAMSYEEARRRIRESAGTQFDPQVVRAALPVLPGADENIPLGLPGLSEPASNGHKNGTGASMPKASEGLQSSFIEQLA